VLVVADGNPIGEYLRARRELVKPEDVGLSAPDRRRRVPGLRRAEVAMLAGVSPDYYMRLEQGRDRRPSPEVLDALARALLLDEDATAHPHRLAGASARGPSRRPREARVPASVISLIDSLELTPAYVQGRYTDVLAVNAMAAALAPFYAVGTNLLRAAFLDPRVQEMYPHWEGICGSLVAAIRATLGPDTDDPRMNELVGELSVRSPWFRALWARHDVRLKPPGPTLIDHPDVGRLELHYHQMPIAAANGQDLVLYHAERSSRSAQSLGLLASMHASRPSDEPSADPTVDIRDLEH
jgi:transcriptional regulator with XRE-family HTH domain